ncbi:hypothetical protein [Phaeospirillum tilakii]|uniref:Phosphate-selective porin O and P n=1 Tax=Phaeospirillum tilakii TaxID=741673 RepID=A0ABW5CI22_9PROT
MIRPTVLLAAGMAAFAAPAALADDAALQAMRDELAKMRQDYENRISGLEQRLQQAETGATQAAATAEAAKKQAETAAETKPADTPGAFNPAIGVVLNGTLGVARRDPDQYRIPGFALGDEAKPIDRGFALGESEINFSASVDQALYGALTVSINRENEVEIEEAFLQTTSLPGGVTLKGGRFKSGIGTLNEQHSHTWDFADAPLPYLAMLNGQYQDDGAQVRWLAPLPLFVEFGAEGFRGDAYPANGAANKGMGAYSAFVHVGDDIGAAGEGGSWRLGASHLWSGAKNRESGDDSFTGNDRLLILDALYKWAPNGNYADRYVKLQGEYFRRDEKGRINDLDGSGTQQGYYAQAVWQFIPQWRVGARYDRVWADTPSLGWLDTSLDPQGHVASRESLMVDYSTSEFGRFRLQGNLDHSAATEDQQLLLQYTISLGAHGAHPF